MTLYSNVYNNSYGSEFYDNVCDASSCNTITIPSSGDGIVTLYFTPKLFSPSPLPITNTLTTNSISDPLTYYIVLKSNSYNTTSTSMIIDVLVIVCVVTTIGTLLLLLILIIYCMKTDSTKLNVGIKYNQNIRLDDI
jgi:hypothetical protein